MSEPILIARALTRIYRVGPAEIRALDALDVDVERGEYVAVVGRSGSGKSTLLQLAGALDTPSAGSLVVDGRDLSSMTPTERAVYRRTTVGFVFQSFHLVASMTAAQNVALALTFQGTFGADRERLTRSALEQVGLTERAGHRPGQLSGGEQQRVALARAIVHRPALLLADEPTGNLDRANAEGVMALLREINGAGTTVLLVTHDEETAQREARRVLRLRDGRLAEAA